MSKNCNECGRELADEVQFCPSCGFRQASQEVQGEAPLSNTAQAVNAVGANQSSSMPQTFVKPMHTTFIFVSTMVFMILFAIRSLMSLISLGVWAIIDAAIDRSLYSGNIFSIVKGSVFVTFLTFGLVLTLFILAASARSKKRPIENKAGLSGALVVFAIIVLIMSVIYMVLEAAVIVESKKLIDAYTGTDLTFSTMYASLVFDIVFISFCVVNLIKAFLFKSFVRKTLAL